MATLAARDQENAVRNLAIGPSGKPINAGSKAFGAKTPGNKTPFKIPLNDENVVKQAGKSVLQAKGKSNENLLMTTKKGGKLDANAFVTPAGPRTRAPLGIKTTNAKTQGFQTPAPLTAKTQKVSPRLHRPKVKIHQPEAEVESEDDVPEIEYMAPKEAPLPDDMDDYLPRDWTIPKIGHKDMVRGIWNAHHNPIEEDGRPRKLREFEEGLEKSQKKAREDFDKSFAAQVAADEAEVLRSLGMAVPKKEKSKAAAAPQKPTTGLSTLRARSAASALSSTAKPSYAVPTTSAKSRVPTGQISSKKIIKPLADRPTSRQAAATAASKSTIGYAQGRAGRVAPAARKPLSNVTKPAPFSATAKRPASAASTARTAPAAVRSRSALSRSSSTATDATLVGDSQDEQPSRTFAEMDLKMDLKFLSQSDDEDEDAWAHNFNSQLHGELDEELEDFQFQLPDNL